MGFKWVIFDATDWMHGRVGLSMGPIYQIEW
jgi:hypothetical protein